MYQTPNNTQINDNDPYTGADGTLYPGNFPKTEIAELAPITLVPKPAFDPLTKAVTETTAQVNGVWTQQWAVTALDAVTVAANQAQKTDQANQVIKTQLDDLDLKSIRALREGDLTRIKALEDQASVLRAQITT